MNSWLLLLLPNRQRDRYGDELVALLDDSSRPIRDRVDVIGRAIIWNMEELVHRSWFVAAAVVAAASLFALGHATALLAGGLADVPRHWWASAPLVGLAVAVALVAIGRRHGVAAMSPETRRRG